MTAPRPTAIEGRFRLRRAWAEVWEEVNPILRDGEPGYDKTNNMLKVGDGITPWNELDYLTSPDGGFSGGEVSDAQIAAAIRAHAISKTPHPVYDDGPSLLLLYQNAKV